MFQKLVDRPVLSIVISTIIVFLGAISLFELPLTQYPEIAPPEVNVTTKYTGANAETCLKAVVTPLERIINGVPNMSYMTSVSGNDGSSIIQIIFNTGTNPDLAAVNVQNRVSSVLDELPEEVIKAGVVVEKIQNSMLLYINLLSDDPTMDEKFLYNYTDINILPELKRIDGVGFADIMGSRDYAMRIWLNPNKMTNFNISTEDVVSSLKEQNVEAAPGKIGESSGKKAQALQYVIKYTGKFNTQEQYENVVIRSNADGELVRLKDIAEVEFGSQEYDVLSKENGRPSAAILLKQRPGSNASDVIKDIKKKMIELQEKFPAGVHYTLSYDVSSFLDASIHEVVKTLIEAFILVALVVFLFLQDLRSTIIPIIAVPVSLIGTFFILSLFGFSLNLITLFALVLAIGIVVDDAIVVVEAVYSKMEHSNISVKEAVRFAIKELSGAVISITLVMSAVFIPTTFLPGSSGVFFRQFSTTMATSIILSGIVALTLTPALCALLLKPHHEKRQHHNQYLEKFLNSFNIWFDKLSRSYLRALEKISPHQKFTVSVLMLFIGIAIIFGSLTPSGFLPNEDQATIYANITTPPGATLERTEKIVDDIQVVAHKIDGVSSVSALAGFSLLSDGVGANFGMNLISLKNWKDRDLSDKEIIDELRLKTSHLKDATIDFFTPPPVPGYGNSSGFELRLLDKSGRGDIQELSKVTSNFIRQLNNREEITNAFTTLNTEYPQFLIKIDPAKAAQKNVVVSDVLESLQTLIGSKYATNFIRFGQMYRVMVQSLPEYRAKPEDINKVSVKNRLGEMVPVTAFLTIEKVYGPEQVTRYNMYPSALINGEPAPGHSSGQAIDAIKKLAKDSLPKDYDYDWAGSSKEQANSDNQSLMIFAICLIFVYLILSAQYESFILPLPVIFSLPVGIFGAFFFLLIMGLENNIYAQVALIMLIGLLSKNAILIVEYASQKQKTENISPLEAAIQGALERLRPILMTSFAFIIGLLPLLFTQGAGKIGNQTIGATAVGGMLFGAVFGLFVIPGLYVFFASSKDWFKPKKEDLEAKRNFYKNEF